MITPVIFMPAVLPLTMLLLMMLLLVMLPLTMLPLMMLPLTMLLLMMLLLVMLLLVISEYQKSYQEKRVEINKMHHCFEVRQELGGIGISGCLTDFSDLCKSGSW